MWSRTVHSLGKLARVLGPEIMDKGPQFLMSTGAGACVGWAVSNQSQPALNRPSLVSWWSSGFVAAAIVGFVLWAWRAMVNHDTKREKITITDVYEVLTGRRELEVSRGEEVPTRVGDSVTVPPGAIIASAIGVGPLTVVVPSGRQFGANPDEPFEFTLNPGPQSMLLEDGGTIRAPLRGTIAGESTVTGDFNDGQGEKR